MARVLPPASPPLSRRATLEGVPPGPFKIESLADVQEQLQIASAISGTRQAEVKADVAKWHLAGADGGDRVGRGYQHRVQGGGGHDEATRETRGRITGTRAEHQGIERARGGAAASTRGDSRLAA